MKKSTEETIIRYKNISVADIIGTIILFGGGGLWASKHLNDDLLAVILIAYAVGMFFIFAKNGQEIMKINGDGIKVKNEFFTWEEIESTSTQFVDAEEDYTHNLIIQLKSGSSKKVDIRYADYKARQIEEFIKTHRKRK